MKKSAHIIPVLITALAIFFASNSSLYAGELKGLDAYDYRDTKRLVMLVHRAAESVSLKGDKAFTIFREQETKWTFAGSYLYIYDEEGRNLFHGGYPDLIGKNLFDFIDLNGKKSVQMLIKESQNPNNPHGWIHYLWRAPGSLGPVWKSSCNYMAKMPDGRKVFIGSGIDSAQPEREFFRVIVDEASDLLARKGRKALSKLKSPASQYTILNSRIFVIDMEGSSIIAPGMDVEVDQCLFDYKDLTGRHPIKELALKLNKSDRAWVVMLNQERAGETPVKKTIYGRQSSMDGEKIIIGAICELPRPAWMN